MTSTNDAIADALANLQSVIVKHAAKNLLNYGELKEVQEAQTALLIALAEALT